MARQAAAVIDRVRAARELHRRNEELARSVADRTRDVHRLATIIEAAHDAIFTRTLDGTITTWNPGAERLHGYSAGEIVGRSCWLLIPPDCRDELEDKHRRLVRGEPVEPFETRRLRKDGQIVVASVALSSIRGAEGEVVGIASIGRDITRRRRAEQALRASEERMRAILNTAADAIISIDRRGVIETVNPAAERIFGYPIDEMIGQHVSMLMPAAFRAEHDGYLTRYPAAGEGRVVGSGRQVEGRRKDGTTFPIDLAVSAVEHLGIFTAIVRDITDRRRAEEARQQLVARLTTITEEERRRIARELHDESSQLLAVLIGGIKAVRDQPGIGAGSARLLQQLQEQADQVGQAVHRIAWELRPAALDQVGLEPALRSWVEQWSEWTGLPVKFYSTLGPDRVRPEVETQLYRLVVEALANVARHAHASRVSVLLERRPDVVLLSVEDDGAGFSPESVGPSGPRRGLGLLGMHERAALLGGTFHVESAPGRGTSVRVRIPLVVPIR